ncbi:helix-turn-helix domain-containing protein [Acetobacter sp.]|uniref:helix-turn-helix domain-containing protein n=1 Tax=Acetobacter sp. TaxID=440 RepID=UPI0025BFA3F2|nr:helix-turn-helix domain-containing protein [Acetobacter sp.]MCH4092533.1 GAF domain-containing protein [Acetobacter sp.]MCI1299667.1 GAF domain-containing protein [Acetobacter sp.]MCI1315453.1 GAF domain-containing protein [Acetobacter sp.]
MSENVLITPDRLAMIPAALRVSWTRCASAYAISPMEEGCVELLCGAELRQACARMGPLMKTAGPELDRLHGIVSTLDYTVLLADPNGIVLARRGDPPQEKGNRRWHLWPGACWSEKRAGTNGIGTSLVEGRPVTVHMDQHWLLSLRYLACSAVPFYGPDGRVAGALDASSTRPDPEGRIAIMMEAVLVDAARRIERRSFLDAYGSHTIVLLGESSDISLPMVALDESRVVVGATFAARQMLKLGDAGCNVCFDLGTQGRGVPDFQEAERAVIEGALAMSGGKVAPAARLLGVSRSTLHRKIRAMEA